jgi:uracil-DNA glycosylase
MRRRKAGKPGRDRAAVYHPSALLRDPEKVEEIRRDFAGIVEKRRELAVPQNGRL